MDWRLRIYWFVFRTNRKLSEMYYDRKCKCVRPMLPGTTLSKDRVSIVEILTGNGLSLLELYCNTQDQVAQINARSSTRNNQGEHRTEEVLKLWYSAWLKSNTLDPECKLPDSQRIRHAYDLASKAEAQCRQDELDFGSTCDGEYSA
jgi:hypothetical protein